MYKLHKLFEFNCRETTWIWVSRRRWFPDHGVPNLIPEIPESHGLFVSLDATIRTQFQLGSRDLRDWGKWKHRGFLIQGSFPINLPTNPQSNRLATNGEFHEFPQPELVVAPVRFVKHGWAFGAWHVCMWLKSCVVPRMEANEKRLWAQSQHVKWWVRDYDLPPTNGGLCTESGDVGNRKSG